MEKRAPTTLIKGPVRFTALICAVLFLASCGGSASAPGSPSASLSAAPVSSPFAKSSTASSAAPSASAAGASASTSASAASSPLAGATVVRPAAGQGEPVKIQLVGTASESAIFIALERGYFKEVGIAPEFVTLDSAARAIPLLGTGDIDIGSGVMSAGLLNAVNRGIGIRIAAPQSEDESAQHSSPWLLVRKDLWDSGAIRKQSDLKGKKIGVFSKGSTNEYFVDEELKRGGLKPSDVQLVELNAGDQAAAFANKAIDVAQGAEPTATVYADRGLAVKWLPASDIAPNFQYTFLFFSQKFADQKTDVAKRWMVAYLRGTRDWQQMLDTGKDKDQIFGYVSKYTPLKDRALFDRTGQPVLPPNPRIDTNVIRKQEDWAKQKGLIAQEPPIDKIVDTRFIDAAMKQLGPYQGKK